MLLTYSDFQQVAAGCFWCPIGCSADRLHSHLLGMIVNWPYSRWWKILFKHDLKVEQTYAFAKSNAKDIIAIGFKPEKTFIFSDFNLVGGLFYQNISRISRQITITQIHFWISGLVCTMFHVKLRVMTFFASVIISENAILLPFKLPPHFQTLFLKYFGKCQMLHVWFLALLIRYYFHIFDLRWSHLLILGSMFPSYTGCGHKTQIP